MNGYFGNILYVDLTQKSKKIEKFDDVLARNYLGGNGFTAKVLFDLVPPGVDPLAAENAVVFAVGPWTDTAIPSASRACVASKSPLTGLFFDSTFGGAWPSTFKRAGYDALVITGRAEKPTYLVVTDEGVRFREAGELWGRPIRESCDRICEREGGRVDVMAIGPAGENRVRLACMVHTWRKSRDGIAGRGGIAAVLGSKNLKAVAVGGKAKFPIHDAKALRDFVNQTAAQVRTGTKGLHTYGTPILVNMINALGALGSHNLQREVFEACKPISGEVMREHYLDKDTTCYKCPIACGKDYEMNEGEFRGTRWKMPEYETIFALGTMLGNSNPGSLLKGNMLCDELGLDTISLGVTMSLLWECYEKGLVSKADLGF
ncbi:MAG: aldehyde ferredoxin oxidoreductase N-terminal domain-containing protein, partial [Nitrospinota bacterium]